MTYEEFQKLTPGSLIRYLRPSYYSFTQNKIYIHMGKENKYWSRYHDSMVLIIDDKGEHNGVGYELFDVVSTKKLVLDDVV